MIAIRVDMNDTIATGHLMRCFAIADTIKEMGGEVCFITADDCPTALIKERGFKSIVLKTNWRDMEGELDVLSENLDGAEVEAILVDSYQVTEKYLEAVHNKKKVMYLDDFGDKKYSVDKLLCYAVYYESKNLRKKYGGEQLLLGCKYAPLRNEFKNLKKKKTSESIKKILLLSGGTDKHNSLGIILQNLSCLDSVNVDVVCGMMNSKYDDLKKRFADNKSLVIHKSIGNIIDYMLDADLVVSAGGTTLYELCACGTPTISYSIADNQLENVRCFDAKGLIKYAGDVRYDDIGSRIMEYIAYYNDETYRKEISREMQELVDGYGAERIARTLMEEM